MKLHMRRPTWSVSVANSLCSGRFLASVTFLNFFFFLSDVLKGSAFVLHPFPTGEPFAKRTSSCFFFSTSRKFRRCLTLSRFT